MATEYRLGLDNEYRELIDLIDLCFGFDEAHSFVHLIPHFYEKQNQPQLHNFVASEDGKLRGAVGFYRHDAKVCGETIRFGGIGNVAVHPESRGKGYMKKLVPMTVDHLISEGCDLAWLGGRRHRYMHFDFERAGTLPRFFLPAWALDQCYDTDRKSKFSLRQIEKTDTELLDHVYADLSSAEPYAPVRPRERLYGLTVNHNFRLFALLENGAYRGYVVMDKNCVWEYAVPDASDLDDMVIALAEMIAPEHLTVVVPPFRTEHVNALLPRCESYTLGDSLMFCVLNYRRTLETFLRLKLTGSPLPDGELRVLIHGRAGDEVLCISVKAGAVSVKNCAPDECKYEFSHLGATRVFFSRLSPERDLLPDFARLWFPLPLWIYASEDF